MSTATATLQCHARRQSNGQWGCLACKTLWDDGDTRPCQIEVPDYKNDPVAYVSLIAVADALGYKLPPKTRTYLDMLDKQYGPQKRG